MFIGLIKSTSRSKSALPRGITHKSNLLITTMCWEKMEFGLSISLSTGIPVDSTLISQYENESDRVLVEKKKKTLVITFWITNKNPF